MQKSETHFEQIPVELVKQIAKKDLPGDKDGNDRAETRIRTSKLKPHRLPSLAKNGRGSNDATQRRCSPKRRLLEEI